MFRKLYIILILSLTLTSLLPDCPAHAYSPVDIADLARPATVGIYASVGDSKYYGTGVIINKEGLILTSTTVVPVDSSSITVYFEDHTSLSAEIVDYSTETQSILLKLMTLSSRNYPYLPLQTVLPTLAEPIYTLGNASNMIKLGDGVSFSAGIVSGLYEVPVENSATKQSKNILVIETDASVNEGQDGGGLINSNGEVVGIISNEYSALRWQGVAIPVKTIIDSISYFNSNPAAVKLLSSPTTESNSFIASAKSISPSIVRIFVDRLYPAETLTLPDWREYRASISDWDTLSPDKQKRIIYDYFSTENLFSANQMLRRPHQAVTGLSISPDGYIITSAFNVESSDLTYIDKETATLRKFEYNGSIDALLNTSNTGLEKVNNRITGIHVVYSDGTKTNAGIIGFSTPLGLALLKADLPKAPNYYNLDSNTVKPVLGEEIAILGADKDSYTINSGIISASSRNNGNYFQTDALLNYGNSGGPIIDRDGNFLGIAARPLTPSPVSGKLLPFTQNDRNKNELTLKDYTSTPNSGISMGIMADRITDTLPKLIAGEGITESDFMSLGLSTHGADPYSTNIVVGSVSKNSPADKAGFRKGDIILKMDGIGIRSWSEINNYISQKKAGQVVIFSIKRPLGKPYVTLNGKKLESGDDFLNFLNNSRDGTKVSGQVSNPAVNQKLYVTLNKNQ